MSNPKYIKKNGLRCNGFIKTSIKAKIAEKVITIFHLNEGKSILFFFKRQMINQQKSLYKNKN